MANLFISPSVTNVDDIFFPFEEELKRLNLVSLITRKILGNFTGMFWFSGGLIIIQTTILFIMRCSGTNLLVVYLYLIYLRFYWMPRGQSLVLEEQGFFAQDSNYIIVGKCDSQHTFKSRHTNIVSESDFVSIVFIVQCVIIKTI